MSFLQFNNILHPLQFGFRHQYSTETANCYFIGQLKLAIHKGQIVGAVFMDIKKAFHVLNHNVLLQKLSQLNFDKWFTEPTQTLQWFKTYLEHRQQCVIINNEKSSFTTLKTGVPQGSILGPLLFTLYINDLPNICPGAGFQMYADDTVVFVSGKSVEAITAQLQQHINSVSVWFQNSGLTLNLSKTVSVCFASRSHPLEELHLTINGQNIAQVKEVKYLGLILDSHLSFESHVKKITRTAKANMYSFRIIRDCLPFHAANIFMHAMIFSHLSYCITSWSQATATTIRPLRHLQQSTKNIR